MKKILLLVAVLALPLAAFAQGRVNFANAGFAISTNYTSVGGTVGAANRNLSPLRVGLFIGASGEANPANLLLAFNNVGGGAAWATNQAAPFSGLFNGGNNFEIQGNAGTEISFQIRAWSIAYNTWGEAVTAAAGLNGVLLGASTIGTITPATGAAPTPNLFGAGAGQVGAFQVIPSSVVPEPSSIALGLLGLGAIALFRRRK